MAQRGDLTRLLRDTMLRLVAGDLPDLTTCQIAVLLICHLDRELQTVRGLAQRLNVDRAAITRAVDRLESLGLARRLPDPLDRRGSRVETTAKAAAFVQTLESIEAPKVAEPTERTT